MARGRTGPWSTCAVPPQHHPGHRRPPHKCATMPARPTRTAPRRAGGGPLESPAPRAASTSAASTSRPLPRRKVASAQPAEVGAGRARMGYAAHHADESVEDRRRPPPLRAEQQLKMHRSPGPTGPSPGAAALQRGSRDATAALRDQNRPRRAPSAAAVQTQPRAEGPPRPHGHQANTWWHATK